MEQTSLIPFPSLVNFLDPALTKDGQPYGPVRYREIVQECYLISKSMNTSYLDLMKVTPIERKYFVEFLLDEQKRTEEAIRNKANQQKQR